MHGRIEYVERGHHAVNSRRSISSSVLALKCGLEATNFAARFDASSSNKPFGRSTVRFLFGNALASSPTWAWIVALIMPGFIELEKRAL